MPEKPQPLLKELIFHREKFFIGKDIQAEVLSPEAENGKPTILDPGSISLKLKLRIPSNYFAELGFNLSTEDASTLAKVLLDKNNFTQRSALAQAGAQIIFFNSSSPELEAEIFNYNPSAYFLVPPQLEIGRIYIHPQPLQRRELAEAVKNNFPNSNIRISCFDFETDKFSEYTPEEVLTWSSHDERFTARYSMRSVAIPIIRSGISTAGYVDFSQLTSARDQLDDQLQIHWSPEYLPDYINKNDIFTLLGETSPLIFPDNLCGVIISGTLREQPNSYHTHSTYITHGFGGTQYTQASMKELPDEKGTRIRTEFITLGRNAQPATRVIMFLYPA